MTTYNNAPLTVYKASAGSGKTFTLAVEFISLLVKNPYNYERILAVTFTNKATEEMKTRIIGQLYGISRKLKDSENYLKVIEEETGLSSEKIVENAGIALSLLIHHYNLFRVQTIDSFFQSVLRNLARELELTANLRIDINDSQIEDKAVDSMIESLDEKTQVLKWIHDYINQNISENQQWNVINDIKKFGMNIFKDFYKEHSKELDLLMKNSQFFEEYIKKLRNQKNSIEKTITDQAKEILNEIRSHQLDDVTLYSNSRRGDVLSYIYSLSNGKFNGEPPTPRIQGYLDNANKWAKKKTGRESEITQLAENKLLPMLIRLEETRKKCWRDYQSAKITLSHLSQIRLLHAIAQAVDDQNKENNRFQLSNTQSLLNSLIKDSDSPFIFEKIGSHLKHIMIDEFQDTSRTQWENFKVLLKNCMSQEESHDLIVGDVKQSIYRWRAGDWKLLNNIEDEFSYDQLSVKPRNINYRSDEKIIKFNNIFFKKAIEITFRELSNDQICDAEQLTKAYQEVEQEIHHKNNEGYIRIELYPHEDYHDKILKRLLDTLDELIQAGAEQKDIAILARNNREIEEMASYLMLERPNLHVVSDEAFRLDASVAITILIDAMRLLTHPDDLLTKARLIRNYQRQVLGNNYSDSELLLANDYNQWLPCGYVSSEQLATTPIMLLTNKLYSLFELEKLSEQNAYVCAFHDVVAEYLRDNPADIDNFLNEWDDSLHQKNIQSVAVDGVRIISIHKSKGMEFDHVVIPWCDWTLEKNSIVWCNKKEESPYNMLPIIPVDFSKSGMCGTVYEEDYKIEHLQNTVDNMNLLYVAFTRPRKSLIVTGKRMSADKLKKKKVECTSKNRSEILEEVITNLSDSQSMEYVINGIKTPKDPICFEYGQLRFSKTKQDDGQPTENVLIAPSLPHTVKIESYEAPVKFMQSNKSRAFIEDEDSKSTPKTDYVKLGNVLHELFSSIHTIEDIEPKLKELEIEGVIYDDQVTAEELRSKLQVALCNPLVADWFAPKWKLYNECSILTKENVSSDGQWTLREYRPDRVMTDGKQTIVVDFKFGKPYKGYIQQVKGYMSLLKDMGHSQLKGYLWYVLNNEIMEINI